MFKTLLTISLILPSITEANIKKDPVVAEVNGKPISRSLLRKKYQENQLYLQAKKVTKESVLDDLINRELGIQRAKKNNLANDPIVRQKIDNILYHAQISQDLESEFKKINVTDADVKKFYSDNKEYRTAHILVRLRASPTKLEVKQGLDQILKIRNEVQKNPDKFTEIANQYSQSTAAPTGGDLGFQPPTRLAPEYYNAIKGKAVGFYTKEPVRTQFGFHLVKILGVKEFKNINLGVYKKIVYDLKRDEIINSYFADARKNAKIKIYSKNF